MLKNHRTTISLASLAALAAGTVGAVVVSAGAEAAVSTVQVRSTDLIVGLRDTRPTGHVDFLREGARVYTEGSTATDKAAEYFAMGPALPTSGSYEWYGTTNQPGAQVVFDLDGDRANPGSFNVLVGEQVYSSGTPGSALTDWWYTGGSARAATRGITCPSTAPGSGSDCHGTLAQWATVLPAATEVYAGGFSLGSGVKGDGVLRALTFGDTTYEFTSQAAAEPTTAPGTTAPTPAPTATATATVRPTATPVTGSVTVKARKRAVVRLTTAALPAGAVEGAKLRYTVRVDRKVAADLTMGAGESNKVVRRFDKRSGKHVVEVFQGTQRVARGVVRR